MKRLIALSDGLWTSSSIPATSNLGILCRGLKTGGNGGAQQLSFVDPFQSIADPSTCGRRITFLKQSICALYQQIALNYAPGDSLWFFGYSRGSFVVRSCIGLIRNIGLLKKPHLHRLGDAWHIYQTSWGADARNAIMFRDAFSHPATVKFLGVFDTVGPLGIPHPSNGATAGDELCFHDNVLSNVVEYACHTLAIDEWRKEFQACPWRTTGERSQTEQCWFTGNHKDNGGIQGDLALSNIPLRWMISRAKALGLVLDSEFVEAAMTRRCEESREDYNSGQVRKTGTGTRPIGTSNSDETLHPSAEQRFLRNRDYRPSNLKAYMQRDDQIQLPL